MRRWWEVFFGCFWVWGFGICWFFSWIISCCFFFFSFFFFFFLRGVVQFWIVWCSFSVCFEMVSVSIIALEDAGAQFSPSRQVFH